MFRLGVFTWLLLIPILGFSFGRDGHLTVAQLATPYLSEATQAEMERLMGKGYLQEWVASANWPQEVSDRPDKKWMQSLHRTWFEPGDTEFLPDKHCNNNRCSVAAILEAQKVLSNNKFTKQQKRQAFKYLVHYVADAHQPTNCGFNRDEGGRKILLKAPDLNKVTLHWVWETGLLKETSLPPFAYAVKLNKDLTLENRQQWAGNTDPASWVLECHEIAVSVAYELARKGKWNSAYSRTALPVIEEQIRKAAIRTAAMLNEIYKVGE